MASREDLIQARSIYIGTSTNLAPNSSNLIVDGLIGVGTTNPGERVSISGNVGFQYSGTQKYHVGYYSGGLNFAETNIADARLFIKDGGNVGIGTISPYSKLDVAGTIITTTTLNSTAGSYSIDHPGINTWKIGVTSTNSSTFHIGNDTGGSFASKLLSITQAGNVGIRTTNPGSQLQVGGYFQIESNANYMGMLGFNRNVNNGQILNPSYGAYQLQNYQGQLQIQVYNSGGSGITEHRFYDNGNVSFNGQLGVTTNPVASLDNQGNLGTYRQRGFTTMVTNELAADGNNANRYEIARATIDYNDWNDTGTIEIELYEKYWSDGLKKRYIVTYGYSAQGNKYLVEMSGIGVNNFMVSIGAPVTITGDIRYLPIYVDVRYYTRVIAVVKTDRHLTTNNPPWVGEIWFNNAPSITYIADTGMDSTVYVGPVMGAYSVFTGGNVGIGTNAPPARLAVAGNNNGLALIGDAGFTDYTGISLNNTLNSSSYNILSSPYDNSLFINRPSGNNINFRENNNDQMVIRYGGFVGINTSNPEGYLDVNTGSARMTTYAYGVDLRLNAGGGGFARANRQYEVNNATTSFFGSYGSTTSGVQRAYWTIGDRNSDEIGYTFTNGIHLLANGNVGIGTTDPTSYPYGGKLNVNGSISSSGGKIGFGVTDAFTAYGYSAAHYGLSYSFSVNPVALSGYYGIGFFTTGSEKMRIAENGNVGIGTTAPVNLLHLTSHNPVQRFESGKPIEWTTDGEALGSINFYKHYGLAQGAAIRMLQDGGTSSYVQAALAFYTNDGSIDWSTPTERMRITAEGKVGIGTGNPGYKIHSTGTGRFYNMLIGSGTYGNIIQPIDDQNMTIQTPSGYISIATGSGGSPSERMTITSGGNIGVGTTAPDPSAIMDLSARRQGFLPPRMTNTEMINIGSPAAGLVVYDTSNNKLTVYTGSSWVPLH